MLNLTKLEEPKEGYIKSEIKFLGMGFTLKDGSKQIVTNINSYKEEPKQGIDIKNFEQKANEIINQDIDFYKLGSFDKNCDDACKYHCTENNTQIAKCLNQGTIADALKQVINDKLIIINSFDEEFVELFNPLNQSLGLINELQLLDIQCQIAEKELEGYYVMIGDLKCEIDNQGELQNWDNKTFDRELNMLLRLKKIQEKYEK